MTNEQIGYIRRAAIPWTAIIAAVGLAWTMVGQLVAVRDDILAHCAAVDRRISIIEEWRVHSDREHAELSRSIERLRELEGKR